VALITQAQWEARMRAERVADATASVLAAQTAALDDASDYVQEFATAAGVTLVAGSLTNAMVRRVAVVASYFAADGVPEYRDPGTGNNPYHARFRAVTAELKEWADRLQPISTDTPAEGPVVLSDDARGWDDPTTSTTDA